MSMDKYILENGIVRPVEDLLEWAEWFEKHEVRVASTYIAHVQVSTVFLGLNHNHGEGDPLLFETMVFGDGIPSLNPGFWSPSMWRYCTLEQARRGHWIVVEKVREFLPDTEPATEQPATEQPATGSLVRFE